MCPGELRSHGRVARTAEFAVRGFSSRPCRGGTTTEKRRSLDMALEYNTVNARHPKNRGQKPEDALPCSARLWATGCPPGS